MDWIIEAIKQVPALTVLGYIVFRFLGYLKGRDDTMKEVMGESRRACKESAERGSVAIEKNSEVLGAVNAHLQESIRVQGHTLRFLQRANGGPQ